MLYIYVQLNYYFSCRIIVEASCFQVRSFLPNTWATITRNGSSTSTRRASGSNDASLFTYTRDLRFLLLFEILLKYFKLVNEKDILQVESVWSSMKGFHNNWKIKVQFLSPGSRASLEDGSRDDLNQGRNRATSPDRGAYCRRPRSGSLLNRITTMILGNCKSGEGIL